MTARGRVRPTAELDLTDPRVVADPYPQFARLRAQGPVLWHEPSRRWLVLSHRDVDAALRDRRLGRWWTDRRPRSRLEPFNLLHRHQMMENEPPEHTRLRRLVARAFARGHVERLRPRVVGLADRLLDAVDPAGFDVIGEYAEPLPVLVVAELLGVPTADHDLLRRWSQAIVRMYEETVPEQTEQAAVVASAEFADYIREHARTKRERPDDSLLSDLVRAQEQEDGLSEAEVVASAVRRDPNPHVGFGAGVHFCLGAPLARMELTGSLRRLLQRFPALSPAEPPRRRPTLVLRGYEAVRVTATGRTAHD
jgi:cytochrome P450